MRSADTKWLARIRSGLGILLCAAAALAASLLAQRSWGVWLPLAFAAVIIALASRFGVAVGFFGSVVSAFIFAYFLLTPVGSFQVAHAGERSNLGWMVLAAIVLSFLLQNPVSRRPRRKQ
jgi:K+-sensing histidine kinase KdpD